jgi:hypothetical protein
VTKKNESSTTHPKDFCEKTKDKKRTHPEQPDFEG